MVGQIFPKRSTFTFLRILVLLTVGIFLFGCSSTTKEKAEIEKLQSELSKTRKELKEARKELKEQSEKITDLENTPEQRFIRAEKYYSSGDTSEAKKEYKGIIVRFEGTKHVTVAAAELDKIDKEIAAREAEEERKKALGWKILKPTSTVTFEDLKIKFERVYTGNRWAFDAHGREYHYRDATRGNRYILARITITSEDKYPSLPPVLVYTMKGGELHYKGTLDYEFRRWQDYGSYLGNYADYGNSFAHSSTISFNLGYQISEEELSEETIFIVMKKIGCFNRRKKDYGRPEVEYVRALCSEKEILTLEDFETEYVLIKRF